MDCNAGNVYKKLQIASSFQTTSNSIASFDSDQCPVTTVEWPLPSVKLSLSCSSTMFRQEGWLSPTERASVSAISLRHILAFPGYAPGTIAVSVTWMGRGLNAGQTQSSTYPSIFNRLRAVARYWSEIATFSYPVAFNALVCVFPLEIQSSR